jgi:mono/diheme cytochrome c family protein
VVPSLLLLAALHAPARAQVSTSAGEASGKALFERACISCHGADGRGAPPSTTGLDVDLPDFTDCKFTTPELNADWHGIIQHGGPLRGFSRKMPAFGEALSGNEIDAIIGYLRGFCRNRAWPAGELNLPRPLVTEKAFPENEAVMTTTFEGSPVHAVTTAFVYEHRFGPRSQYEIVVPIAAVRAPTPGWYRGLGDVAVAAKHALVHDPVRGAIVSAGGEVTFPTGKEYLGLGRGLMLFEPFVAYGQILPRDGFLHVQAGMEFPRQHNKASREAFWRAATGWSYTQNGGSGRTWSPMIELVGAREFEADATAEWDLVPQMQVTLSRRGHIMASGGVRLPINSRAGSNKQVIVYLLWDWFDGGFFSGW